MEAEIARIISRAPFTDRKVRIGFGITLMLVVLHTGFDARAEKLTLERRLTEDRDLDDGFRASGDNYRRLRTSDYS
jgi:hypothetical protein